MVLELAILNVIPGKEADFERAFAEAKGIILTVRHLLERLSAGDVGGFTDHLSPDYDDSGAI
jgi:hypothetical protein